MPLYHSTAGGVQLHDTKIREKPFAADRLYPFGHRCLEHGACFARSGFDIRTSDANTNHWSGADLAAHLDTRTHGYQNTHILLNLDADVDLHADADGDYTINGDPVANAHADQHVHYLIRLAGDVCRFR